MVGVKLSKKNILILSLVAWYVTCVVVYGLFLILFDYDIAERIKNTLVAAIFASIAGVGHIYIEKRIYKA
jgi:intracellular septation protein A